MFNCDVAFWTHTTNVKIASYRLRALNVLNALRQRGVNVKLYSKRDIPKILILSKRYDENTLIIALNLNKTYGTKIGLDLCDNHFFNETNNKDYIIKKKLLFKAVESVDFVIASTEALKEEIVKYTKVKKIVVIGDTVEQPKHSKNFFSYTYWYGYYQYIRLKYFLKDIKNENRFIWFGNHGSPNADGGMEDLTIIIEALEKLNQTHIISLSILSNNKNKYKKIFKKSNFKTIYLEWNNYFFSKYLALHSLSLIPVKVNDFTKCKTNNRVATSIFHKLSVVCSCIPAYQEIIDCVESQNAWQDTIIQYMNNTNRINQINTVFDNIKNMYSDEIIYKKWQNLIIEELL